MDRTTLSYHTIVLFGLHRSANVPPINENTKIGDDVEA